MGNKICQDPTLEEVKNQVAEWSDETFGKEVPFRTPLHHLKEEVEEVLAEGELEEYADCLLLLMDSFRKAYPGVHANALLYVCFAKIKINQAREWGAPDENGVRKHIEKKGRDVKEKEAIRASGICCFPGCSCVRCFRAGGHRLKIQKDAGHH